MKIEKLAIIFLIVVMLIQSYFFLVLTKMYLEEHDLSVIRCETINMQSETINTFIDLSEEMLGTKLEKSKIVECREPFMDKVKNKLQEIKNE